MPQTPAAARYASHKVGRVSRRRTPAAGQARKERRPVVADSQMPPTASMDGAFHGPQCRLVRFRRLYLDLLDSTDSGTLHSE